MRISYLFSICLFIILWWLCATGVFAAEPPTGTAKQWPDVLVIDNFENGLDHWENQGTGNITLADGAVDGKKVLLWTATDDGIGHIAFKGLDRKQIDFSQYDLLTFRVKIDGKPLWNVGPIVQQYPAVYGFRGLYYSINTFRPLGKWFLCTQDLSRWANVSIFNLNCYSSFDTEKQEFAFEISQLAGAGHTKVYFDDIRLLKNPIGLKLSYPGLWSALPDGSQVNHFHVVLENRKLLPLHIAVKLAEDDPGTLHSFHVELPAEDILLLPGEKREVTVAITAPADVINTAKPWYGEMARVAVSAREIPGLTLFTELMAGTRPVKPVHPCLLSNPEAMKTLRKQWNDPELRKTLDSVLTAKVKAAEEAIAFQPKYPPLACQGLTTDPVSGGKLVKINVPNLPFAVYQDPKSGRTYSGPLYDAGMQGMYQQHMQNAENAETLGIGYLVTGRKEFAAAAARILTGYIDSYLKLPIMAPTPNSPVGSVTSGATRIHGSFMFEQRWLRSLSVALDCIQPAGVLTEEEKRGIADKVFEPSASLMLDHKVGVMNLQWQIQGAAVFAGLAAEIPGIAARGVYDTHGVLPLLKTGFLPDGNWWENPSYQNVAKIASYPVLVACLDAGIIPWDEHLANIFKAAAHMYGPDGHGPILGTGGEADWSLDITAVHMLASHLNDPELAWIYYNRVPPVYYDLRLMALLRAGTPKVPKEQAVSPIPQGTVNFPDYGGITLRIPGTDRYCYFHYGREVVHGHQNKLSFQVYGKGSWYARNVMGGYEHNFTNFLQTVASANTIMVDGKNADMDTGELLFTSSRDGAEIASARTVGAWKDVRHERTLVLTAGPLVVLDQCRSDSEHTYDWLYYPNACKLSLARDNVKPAKVSTFGDSPLYSSLPVDGAFTQFDSLVWTRPDQSGMKMALIIDGTLYASRVKDTFVPCESLLWRKIGKTVAYAAAFWPYAKGEAGEVRITSLPVMAGGKRVGVEIGQAVHVTAPEGAWDILVNYTGTALTAGHITGNANDRVSVVKLL